MYNNIDSAAKGISDYTSRIERMKTIVAFRASICSPVQDLLYPGAQAQAGQVLHPRGRLDPYAKYTRSEVVTTPPGTTTVSETYEDRLRFSVEFAKRWGNLALRMGLIESRGGIGADYFAFDDRVKFSLDAWNFSSTEPGNLNTHMKASLNYTINKLLLLNAGYDNFLNSDRAAAFVGVGLRFDDDDLKYLLGSVPVPK